MTIARAGGDPRRAVMVGDSNTDIAAARNAGIPVIAVPFGYTDTPVRLLGPDRIDRAFRPIVRSRPPRSPARLPHKRSTLSIFARANVKLCRQEEMVGATGIEPVTLRV